jgi:hypothetical protein
LSVSEEITSEGQVGPGFAYRQRLDERKAARTRLGRSEGWIANLRVVVFLTFVAIAWKNYDGSLHAGWLAVPVLGFAGLVVIHARLRRGIRRAERAVAFYRRGLDRLGGDWIGKWDDGGKFADDLHPFAADLDLFGRASLFERMNSARTAAGESALAVWLKAPETSPASILERQAAVAEMASRLDFREELDLLGGDVRGGLDPAGLVSWGLTPPILPDRRFWYVALALGLISALTLIGWLFVGTGPGPFLAAGLVELGFWAWIRERTSQVLGPLDERAGELSLLAELLGRIEREKFVALSLRRLRDGLITGGEPPSRHIARLARLLRRVESGRNQFVAPFSALLMSGTRLSFAVEAWRSAVGPAIGDWIASVGAIEAFGSIGSYAYENPADPFPEIVTDGPIYEAESLGHPLIPVDRNVRNDIRLGGALRVLVVSGSNMSGKSTMLRTVGINAVMAMIGGPVRANRLRLSPLLLGATLRVQDSLQAGTSRFYAELTRLREVVRLAGGSPPLLFLLDEIFHGTNSDDRRIGAEGVVRGLIEKGAIGLVTTHDLALAAIADDLAPRAVNVHFSDRFEDGKLVFDYTMKPGVVRHSNALALMRAVGLEV